MARSCGIHIDQRRFHVVALDGSAKRSKVLASAAGEIPAGANAVAEAAAGLKRIVKEHGIKADAVSLAVDSGLAAFRHLTVPFDDRAKIEDIIRFEVESDLPQWNIDEVVVDFLVLATKPGVESSLLVTAVPEQRLEPQLTACERGGLEATTAELAGTALFQAAHSAGRLAAGSAQVLVHVGDSSTTVVVADDGRLVSMRAIRAGALAHEAGGFGAEAAPGGANGNGNGGELADDGASSEAELAAAAEARAAQTAMRIRRELGRTVSGALTEHPIEAIYVCGHTLEGLSEETLFDVPVHELAPGTSETEVLGGELTVAHGAALRALGGGVLTPELRRDELRYSGKFERLELPLAVFAVLLCTLLGVQLIVLQKQIDWRDEGQLPDFPGDIQMWASYCTDLLVPNEETGWPGRVKTPSPQVQAWIDAIEKGTNEELTKYEELIRLRERLKTELATLKEEVGVASTSFPQPLSALHGFLLVMNTIYAPENEIGRVGIRYVHANYQQARRGRTESKDSVVVRLDIDFFDEEGTTGSQKLGRLRSVLESQPWFIELPEESSRTFDGGISVDAFTVTVDVAQALEEEEPEV